MGSGTYKHYLLTILTALVLFNYVDRMALAVVLQSIKVDLHLSDTQLGFLGGIAFALFYSIMGVPIARWADRGNRVAIILLSALLWSVAVALCGFAASFAQLLLIRIGVGVGEAGCMPPAFSLISDYFTRGERPRAFAIYGFGSALSFVVGLFGAGWLNERYGWRVTFMLLGIPGLILAALSWLTLKEPRQLKAQLMSRAVQPSLRQVCNALWRCAAFRHLTFCNALLFLFGYGILQWQPSFFMRSYGFTSGQIGAWLALTYGVGSFVGMYLGGEWATRFAAGRERLQLRAMALAIGTAGGLAALAYGSRSPYLGLALIAVHVLLVSSISPMLNATTQTLVPESMRALSVALGGFVANLVGLGLGPLLAGALSDTIRSLAGKESLRYALMALAPGYLWGAWHAWRASQTVTRDLAL